ncbi:hypothetical protein B0H15DRAFT_934719 [Mycena belliarum]|uniref:Methyltransferase type 11 domain-containing protein n=1 Tax=Mycena belliarum TaxID=1033014 RepID=A0AAD6TP60_9AGAR|nr:hypothetical protein B0H15DRAFT_934719 [Mycena belliae]
MATPAPYPRVMGLLRLFRIISETVNESVAQVPLIVGPIFRRLGHAAKAPSKVAWSFFGLSQSPTKARGGKPKVSPPCQWTPPDAAFDAEPTHQVLQHVADSVRALREMTRVAKPGGVVPVRDTEMTGYPDDVGISLWREMHRQVARANGGSIVPEAITKKHINLLHRYNEAKVATQVKTALSGDFED